MQIGLVEEGGRIKCAYNAAILDAFLDNGIAFDYRIGVSNLVAYLAGQQGRNLRFFTEYIHAPEYFGLKSLLKTGDLFGIRHICGDLTREDVKAPLDFPTFLQNSTEYVTGEAEYFGKDAMKQDAYRLIMASSGWALSIVVAALENSGAAFPLSGASEDGRHCRCLLYQQGNLHRLSLSFC